MLIKIVGAVRIKLPEKKSQNLNVQFNKIEFFVTNATQPNLPDKVCYKLITGLKATV